MELGSKKVGCKCCSTRTRVPSGAHIGHCPCQATTRGVQPNDSLSHTVNKFKDLVNAVSSNINMMMVSAINHYQPGLGALPQSQHPRPLLPPLALNLAPHKQKRAVLCGVSYHGQRFKLNGCVNDVKCMKYLLMHRLGFPADSILMLTEEESNPHFIPTKSNIRRALQWLVQGCQPGDSLVFHYSGHASQQIEYNKGDEKDGYDEALWPVDHQTMGTIVDDEINATIVRPLPRGAKLHAIIDACHSGTILDLPFVCKMNRDGFYKWEDQNCYKGTSGGLAVSFSACADNQVAIDTTALSSDNAATGAMTYSFIQAVQNEPAGLTYGRLLNAMYRTIREARGTGSRFNGPIVSLLKKVLHPKSQVPQLSSSEIFDIHTRQIVM